MIERSLVRREVENIAQKAEQYVTAKFSKQTARSQAQAPDNICYRILVELDGSHVRTGMNITSNKAELTSKRQLKKCSRQIDWREVRVGFARPVTNKEQRIYVARMDKYPPVVGQLKSAAYLIGMTSSSQVYAVADGGNGLRSALESEFPKLVFILDRAHLKQHIYQGADCLGLTGFHRKLWVEHILNLIELNQVKRAIKFIKRYCQPEQKTQVLDNLCNYLERFKDACKYRTFR